MKKVIVLSALVLFIFSFSFKLFLDWDDANEHRHTLMLDGYYIEEVETTYEPNQTLVPKGSFLTMGDVDEITYTYDLLVMPDRTISSDFQNVVLRTAEGEVSDVHGLFNIETRTLSYNTLKDAPYDAMTVESTITLDSPQNDEQSKFLNDLQSLSFNVSLNSEE